MPLLCSFPHRAGATPAEQGHSFSSPSPLNQGQNPSVLSYALPDVLNVFDEIAARQLIFNFPEELIADAGILALMEHADFEGIEQPALVICSDIASIFDNLKYVKPGPN